MFLLLIIGFLGWVFMGDWPWILLPLAIPATYLLWETMSGQKQHTGFLRDEFREEQLQPWMYEAFSPERMVREPITLVGTALWIVILVAAVHWLF